MADLQNVVSRRHFLGIAGLLGLSLTGLAACTTQTVTPTAGPSGAGGTTTSGRSKFSSTVVAQTVSVAADPSGALKWDRAEYTAAAGDVTFVVVNQSPVPHQFGVEGNGINYASDNLQTGTTTNLTIMGLKAGDYMIVCDYPGHREAGMVAKLTVK